MMQQPLMQFQRLITSASPAPFDYRLTQRK